MTVFIVNDSGHDFSGAEEFGELVYMTTGLVDKYHVTKMKRLFDRHIQASHPRDFILHTGPGVMSAIACSMFAARHGRLNLLLWRAESNGTDRYIYRKLVFSQREEKDAKQVEENYQEKEEEVSED